ncbi:hypothetical protein Bca52824_047849 [Brassica carinata]|uniref:DUF4283 domain-containing protein n=1 Tax=Brassica carinata TaxID=52824 RepID=A0A8X7RHC7_BRACI|nr:hypothetical protein Bca52824_047849 [Brassica carinata]
MLALARWQPKKSLLFPSEIMFWVRVLGVPMEFRTAPTFESISDALGRTVAVDIEHSRVLVVEAAISLRYEKLFGYCPLCSSLCHKEEKCPLAKKASPEKKREARKGNGGWYDGGKHDDQARSYKGVVINGNQNQQHKERDGREYYGKGKDKMMEETDSKWVKVADRGNNGSFTNHRNYRGDGDGSRYRSSRREESRAEGQEGPPKEVAQEEGEIKTDETTKKTLPSHDFQEELAKTQAAGLEVISDPIDAEKGLQMIKSLVAEPPVLEEDKVMDMDECKAIFLEHGIDTDAADDLQDCSEGEFEEMLNEQEDGEAIQVGLEIVNIEEEKETVAGEAVKRQGTRKRLFKPSTTGSTKMRIAYALVSPRKRVQGKVGTCHGENSKQQENKGTSNPKTGMQNP